MLDTWPDATRFDSHGLDTSSYTYMNHEFEDGELASSEIVPYSVNCFCTVNDVTGMASVRTSKNAAGSSSICMSLACNDFRFSTIQREYYIDRA